MSEKVLENYEIDFCLAQYLEFVKKNTSTNLGEKPTTWREVQRKMCFQYFP